MICKIVHYKMKPGKGQVAVEALEKFVGGISSDELGTFYDASRGRSIGGRCVFRWWQRILSIDNYRLP